MSEACARMSKGIVTDGQKEKNKIDIQKARHA